MKTIRDITAAFAALATTPAGAQAVEVMTARNYGVLLAALVEDDIGEVCTAAATYVDGLQDTILYNGPTARDALLLNGVWEALSLLAEGNTSGVEDRVYEGLRAALATYNRSR